MSSRLPFYSEGKILLVLYLVSSSTRGSSTVYRAWVHPALVTNEAEIDSAILRYCTVLCTVLYCTVLYTVLYSVLYSKLYSAILRFRSRTLQTVKQWVTAGLHRLGEFS